MHPKYTALLAGVVLNPEPEIITVVPTGPEEGLKEVITGAATENDILNINRKTNSRYLPGRHVFFIPLINLNGR